MMEHTFAGSPPFFLKLDCGLLGICYLKCRPDGTLGRYAAVVLLSEMPSRWDSGPLCSCRFAIWNAVPMGLVILVFWTEIMNHVYSRQKTKYVDIAKIQDLSSHVIIDIMTWYYGECQTHLVLTTIPTSIIFAKYQNTQTKKMEETWNSYSY